MANMNAESKIKSVQWEAVVIRADGTREDLGVISYWHKNPLKRLQHRISEKLRNGNSSN